VQIFVTIHIERSVTKLWRHKSAYSASTIFSPNILLHEDEVNLLDIPAV